MYIRIVCLCGASHRHTMHHNDMCVCMVHYTTQSIYHSDMCVCIVHYTTQSIYHSDTCVCMVHYTTQSIYHNDMYVCMAHHSITTYFKMICVFAWYIVPHKPCLTLPTVDHVCVCVCVCVHDTHRPGPQHDVDDNTFTKGSFFTGFPLSLLSSLSCAPQELFLFR